MKNILTLLFLAFIIHSTCISQDWESLDSATDYILFDISFPPDQNQVGYAAGSQYTWDSEGVIVKTTDGGDSWTQIVGGPNTPGFEAICFTSPEVGYVGGWDGYFAKTTDGGQTWQTMTAGLNNWFFMDIEFNNENMGVALANLNSGGSGLYRTDNAGEIWSEVEVPDNSIQDICYGATSTTIYAVGSNESIYRSYTVGLYWSQMYSGMADRFFMGVDFNGDFGVVGGEDGKILYTTNEGTNWNSYATGYQNFQGVHVFENDSAYVGGTDEDIYKTINSGYSWEQEDSGTGSASIYKIKFLDDGTGFICGSQGMIKRRQVFVEMQAGFSGETGGCNWEQANFHDESIGFVQSWEWTFSGPETYYSTAQNPEITLSTPGIYNVSLKVSGWGQQDSTIKEAFYESYLCPGLVENEADNIKLYPNPAQDFLQIEGVNGEAFIKILDLAGKLIYSEAYHSQIDISPFAEGTYMIHIETGGVLVKQKFIIQR